MMVERNYRSAIPLPFSLSSFPPPRDHNGDVRMVVSGCSQATPRDLRGSPYARIGAKEEVVRGRDIDTSPTVHNAPVAAQREEAGDDEEHTSLYQHLMRGLSIHHSCLTLIVRPTLARGGVAAPLSSAHLSYRTLAGFGLMVVLVGCRQMQQVQAAPHLAECGTACG
ncbi:hypothetical protein E2C01_017829 [Portunus trituberculatus]|uniref:Uncharacterized protein n=1 Tax=Portunus trituberculatus TaxID=210409 RepID=A0A5B7DUW3_PORTR|nr:hypothetical protein [Portunus trituberculatus]